MLRRKHYDELGLVFLHHYIVALWFAPNEQWKEMLIMYCVGGVLQWIYLVVFFGLNHFAEERIENVHVSWPRWQAMTAVNWAKKSTVAATLAPSYVPTHCTLEAMVETPE